MLISFAALTSSISLLEGPTAWVIEKFGLGRRSASVLVGSVAFSIGVACALGYNVLSDVRLLGFWSLFENADILDTIDGFTGKIMLPLGALLVSILLDGELTRIWYEKKWGFLIIFSKFGDF